MNEDELKKIIELAESKIYKSAKKLRNIVFTESYEQLIEECNDISYELNTSISTICKAADQLSSLY